LSGSAALLSVSVCLLCCCLPVCCPPPLGSVCCCSSAALLGLSVCCQFNCQFTGLAGPLLSGLGWLSGFNLGLSVCSPACLSVWVHCWVCSVCSCLFLLSTNLLLLLFRLSKAVLPGFVASTCQFTVWALPVTPLSSFNVKVAKVRLPAGLSGLSAVCLHLPPWPPVCLLLLSVVNLPVCCGLGWVTTGFSFVCCLLGLGCPSGPLLGCHCQSVCLSVCLPVHLSVCPFVCLLRSRSVCLLG